MTDKEDVHEHAGGSDWSEIVALVTGTNKPDGIGRAFVQRLSDLRVRKIYATARNVESIEYLPELMDCEIVPLSLDITDASQVEAIAHYATDVSMLVNNAGVAHFAGFLAASTRSAAYQEMEVNYFGTLSMVRAFAPVLHRNAGGMLINIASIASFVNFPVIGSYSASKAAVHSLTQGVRAELADQGTRVVGVYPGPVETEMTASMTLPKVSAQEVTKKVFAALEAGEEDIFPDGMAATLRQSLLFDPKEAERQISTLRPTGD